MFAWKDILERAMWTAIEVAACAIPVNAAVFQAQAWKTAASSVAITLLAYAASVLKNLAKQHLETRKLGVPVAVLAEVAVAERVAEG